MDTHDSLESPRDLDVTALSESELSAAGFMLFCHERCASAVPDSFLESAVSHALSGPVTQTFAQLLNTLIEQRIVVRVDRDGELMIKIDDDVPTYLSANQRLLDAHEEVAAEIRRRTSPSSDDFAVLITLSQVSDQGEVDWEVLMRCLGDPPVSLPDSEHAKVIRSLCDEGWLFVSEEQGIGDTFTATSKLWAWSDYIEERILALSDSLRTALANAVADQCELSQDSPLRHALHAVDRADIVPDESQHLAYRSFPVPFLIDEAGQVHTTSVPGVCALIAKSVDLKSGDRVLVCGVKAGFTAALIAQVVGEKGRVVCLESNKEVGDYARRALARAGFDDSRIEVRIVEDVTVGDHRGAPWDAVVINGSIPKIPTEIIDQMNDGGRLVTFIHDLSSSAEVGYVIRKNQGMIKEDSLSRFRFTPIYGKHGWDDLNRLREEYERARRGKADMEVRDAIERRCPYPLARAFASASNSGSAQETHARTLKSLECLIKYLALPLCSIRDSLVAEKILKPSPLLTKIIERPPTMGVWRRAVTEFVSETAPHHPWAHGLNEALHKRTEDAELVGLAKFFSMQNSNTPYNKTSVTLMKLLEDGVTYRNRSPEGHGPPASGAALEERSRILLSGFGKILTTFRIINEAQLWAIQSVETTRLGTRIQGTKLVGNAPRRVPEMPSPEGLSPYSNMMVLQPVQGKWINLDPWMVFCEADGRGENECFLFSHVESESGKRMLYSTYHNGLTYPPNHFPQFEEIKRRNQTDDVETSAFEDFLREYVLDGVIQKHEMDVLVKLAMNHNKSKDWEGQRQWVIEQAKRLSPGVTFESETAS